MAEDNTLPFRKDGYTDPNTGMYTVPDPEVNEKAFDEYQIGDKSFWLPRPSLKPKRMIQFGVPHAYLSVQESMDACREMIDKAKSEDAPLWFKFIEPIYGTTVAVHRDQLRSAIWIMEGYEDLDALKTQIAMADQQKTQARMALMAANRGKN